MRVFKEEQAVARLAEIVALECGVTSAKARQIRVAAALHDVGKQKIPAEILSKPGELTAAEFEVMKTHTTLGAAMLESVQGELGIAARTIARYHHENWDDTGYWGKHLCELPHYVGIVAIADVFTALLYGRPYKQPWHLDDALAYINSMSGTQFSPALVEVFISLAQNDSRVREVFRRGGDSHSGGH